MFTFTVCELNRRYNEREFETTRHFRACNLESVSNVSASSENIPHVYSSISSGSTLLLQNHWHGSRIPTYFNGKILLVRCLSLLGLGVFGERVSLGNGNPPPGLPLCFKT